MPIAQADTAINGTTKWQRHWERYPATLKWSFHPSIPVFERAIALSQTARGLRTLAHAAAILIECRFPLELDDRCFFDKTPT